TLNYGNEKRRPFVNVERRMLNYDNVKQRRVENVEQQNLRFGTVKFNVNSQSGGQAFDRNKPLLSIQSMYICVGVGVIVGIGLVIVIGFILVQRRVIF
ncbi:hypothetical protein HPB47_022279, partial [Ixodes persulcatus]